MPVGHTECTLKPHDDWGDLMTVADWMKCVDCSWFIDYDGFGHLATETEKSDIVISPSQAKRFVFPTWATHVVWYNR